MSTYDTEDDTLPIMGKTLVRAMIERMASMTITIESDGETLYAILTFPDGEIFERNGETLAEALDELEESLSWVA